MSDVRGREAAAMRLLAEAGLRATVRAAGQDAEIAAVALPVARLPEVAAHAAAIRALGFRYIALEIGPAVPADPAEPATG